MIMDLCIRLHNVGRPVSCQCRAPAGLRARMPLPFPSTPITSLHLPSPHVPPLRSRPP